MPSALALFLLLVSPTVWAGPAVSTGPLDEWRAHGCGESSQHARGEEDFTQDPEDLKVQDSRVVWDPITQEFRKPGAEPEECTSGI